MSRSTELARLAIRRHEATGMGLGDSIAAAIRQALREQSEVDDLAQLPHAVASAVRLLREHGRLTPTMLARYRAVSVDACRRLLLVMLERGIVVRERRGVYALGSSWKRQAVASVERWHERRLLGSRRGAETTNARHAGAA